MPAATFGKVDIDNYDVVVVGGGAAGVGAAVGARQAAPEARVLLVESEGCLGGAITHRGVLSFCGLYTIETQPRQAIGGVWTEIREKLLRVNGTTEKPVRHRGIFQVKRVFPMCKDSTNRTCIRWSNRNTSNSFSTNL